MKVVVSFFQKASRHGEVGSYIARHRIGVWWRSRLLGVWSVFSNVKSGLVKVRFFFFLNFKQCLHQNNTAPYYFTL